MNLVYLLLMLACQNNKPLQSYSKDLTLNAINDLLETWYGNDHTTDFCKNGKYKINVCDTLKLWKCDLIYPNEFQSELLKIGIDTIRMQMANTLLSQSDSIDFVKNRVIIFPFQKEEAKFCLRYYFSPLIQIKPGPNRSKVGNDNKYVIQYRMFDLGYLEESLLLLELENGKFKIADHLLVQFKND